MRRLSEDAMTVTVVVMLVYCKVVEEGFLKRSADMRVRHLFV